ncbi:CU044_2847 family protein [Streptomyces sp. ME02-6977A]|uniref:CU044_2847 family protein n=2 Tax=Streptomyces TaxID=1883 RepID=A0ACD4X0F7_STRVN|nr:MULTISPECIES: CU044_2847 family protein [unclassified Streptomyces]MDX3346381.1 CU044_2847 family protein [Streptomyces sp. ME02-6979A]MDX3400197.1 CU044_2847 family protein [Streptomyces sp. ME01-18h]MDX3406550.1 CU044_2847 family protein [Streptomyces sp. ME02-6977A]WOZ03329.1 CU044_2847 family protein [Streptomyces violaceoruber]
MDGLVEFRTEDGVRVVVEGVEDEDGARLVSRGDGPARAARTFEDSLDGVRAAAASALRVFRDGSLRPDAVELEFGVKLSAEAGAVIAKGSAEGHLVVRLNWSPEPSPTRPEPRPSATRPEPRPSPAGPEAPDAAALS